jgi:hypothetical protein
MELFGARAYQTVCSVLITCDNSSAANPRRQVMTAVFPASLSTPASVVEDRFVVIRDPRPGTIIELAPGSHLAVTFRRGIGASSWHVTELPGHVLLLAERGHEFQFLVFGHQDGAVPVRFERRHPERDIAHEVCELLVVPVTDRVTGDLGRTPRSA